MHIFISGHCGGWVTNYIFCCFCLIKWYWAQPTSFPVTVIILDGWKTEILFLFYFSFHSWKNHVDIWRVRCATTDFAQGDIWLVIAGMSFVQWVAWIGKLSLLRHAHKHRLFGNVLMNTEPCEVWLLSSNQFSRKICDLASVLPRQLKTSPSVPFDMGLECWEGP